MDSAWTRMLVKKQPGEVKRQFTAQVEGEEGRSAEHKHESVP